MRVGTVKLLLGVVLVCGMSAALPAQDMVPMSNLEACQTVSTMLPHIKSLWSKAEFKKGDMDVVGARITPTGLILNTGKKKGAETSVGYGEIALADASTESHRTSVGAGMWYSFGGSDPLDGTTPQINIHSTDGDSKLVHLRFAKKEDSQAVVRFSQALNHLAGAARSGRPVDCASPRQDDAAELAAFTQQAAAWRGMNPKPPLSDEVKKKWLLADDDVANKNLAGAIEDYEAGVKLDPTWAQGWYNSAFLYSEQQNYERAAFNMRHYLILLPDAPDAAVAKDKMLLWEARAEKAARK